MKELIEKRKKREKHFLNEDGTITAQLFNKDVHFFKNGKYEEIDNTLIDKGDYFENKLNEFSIKFYKSSNKLINITKDNHYLDITMNNIDFLFEKNEESINYKNDLFDINYKIDNSKLKESIILKNRDTVPEFIEFIIYTDMQLKLKANKQVSVLNDDEVIFTIDAPFMIDILSKRTDDVNYVLEYNGEHYILKLYLDYDWLKSEETTYPVIVDPTIINGTGENVYDAFITTEYLDTSRGNSTMLKVGTNESETSRMLLKFELPTIDTGCTIIGATAYLTAYYTYGGTSVSGKVCNVHAITSSWDESTVTWNNMHNNYDSNVESIFTPIGSTDNTRAITSFDMTSIVKKWYSGKENYGVMIKWNNESYVEETLQYVACSKNYDLDNSTTYRPYLTITYVEQDGIRPYMTYAPINYSNGSSNINYSNGNIVNKFLINKTIGSKLPINLEVVSNTSDVIKDESIIAKGWKFNYSQYIVEETIDSMTYLKYVDNNGTTYYFYSQDGKYVNEEGIKFTIIKENTKYILSDEDGNKKEFTDFSSKFILTKIISSDSLEINIEYLNNNLSKIIDSNNKEINISYSSDNILISSDHDEVTLNISNNLLNSIETKFGITNLYYNTNNIVNKIVDVNGTYMVYDYYDSIPYKIKDVIQYGKNDALGKSLNFNYSYNLTTVIDNEGKKMLYLLDLYGNVIGTTMYNNDSNKLCDAYGNSQKFITNSLDINQNNKISSSNTIIKYVNNLLINSSFESELTNLNYTISGATRVNDCSKTGQYSLKIGTNAQISYNIINDNTYTISVYIKNDLPVTINLYKDVSGTKTIIKQLEIEANSIFNRYDLSGLYEEENSLIFEILNSENANVYIDDIQLEIGSVANTYNLIDNSDFSDGMLNWQISGFNNETGEELSDFYAINTSSSGEKYLTANSNVDSSWAISKYFPFAGKKGDVYHLSFWYKNKGILDTNYEFAGNMANMVFYNTDPEMGSGTYNIELNRHAEEWQYFNDSFVAENDYTDFRLNIISQFEVNSISVTNFMLIKELGKFYCNYDAKGNLISMTDINNNTQTFNYDKNNQLLSVFSPKGNNLKYEYDNEINNRTLRSISPTGISSEVIYDENNNPIKTIVTNVNKTNSIINGEYYNIRLKGTHNYLKCNLADKTLVIKEKSCNQDSFGIESNDNYYYLTYSKYYVTAHNENIILSEMASDNSLFQMTKNVNDSYTIFLKSDFTKCLTLSNDKIVVATYEEDNYLQQFYFEDSQTSLYTETTAEYTEDGCFINKITDSLGNATYYKFDLITGLLKSTITNNIKTEYDYNLKEQITKKNIDKKVIEYKYDNNSLSQIITNNKCYNFEYDDFLNLKQVKINDKVLITNNYYERNGKIYEIQYSNGGKIVYSYNDLGEIDTITKNNITYNYKYNNLGDLSEINSVDEKHKYYYDFSNRVNKYLYNENYILESDFNNNGNIIKETAILNNVVYSTNYEYNSNDFVTKVVHDNFINNINYDELGRVINTNINENLNLDFSYITNGTKTSLLIDKYTQGEDVYNYYYDSLDRIIIIKLNENMINEYKYDNVGELIEEIDYLRNKKIMYLYDNDGNIQEKKEVNISDDSIINKVSFKYENDSWKDQLTSYNEKTINYDIFGNMTKIGNSSLLWEGYELKAYNDSNNNVLFEYNVDGFRKKKIVNNEIIEYYSDGKDLILETRNNHVIQYNRDNKGLLIGLKYDNIQYFYKKDIMGNIIGIYDQNYNQIVEYKYDSWGNILSILDENKNEVSTSHIGYINPFRYKEYYYDNETSLYYLGNRYYSPELGRFISCDEYLFYDILGVNLYLYCGNDPVNKIDKNGEFWWAVAQIAIPTVIASTIKVVSNIANGKKPLENVLGTALGTACGAMVGMGWKSTLGAITGGIMGSFVSSTINECEDYLYGRKEPTKKNVLNSTKTVLEYSMAGGMTGGISSYLYSSSSKGANPKKILTSFVGKKAQKILVATFIESIVADCVDNLYDKLKEEETKKSQNVLISFYPYK